jgi:DinB superfamily
VWSRAGDTGQMAFDRCEECGFEYHEEECDEAGARIVEGAKAIAAAITSLDEDPSARSEPSKWSPLEYACHARDVLLVQRERVLLARVTDRPSLAPMNRDERVEYDGYAAQFPGDVSRQLNDAAAMFANVLSRLGAGDWERTLVYNFPAPTERSLKWVAVHTLHEIRHHLLDVQRQRPAATTS